MTPQEREEFERRIYLEIHSPQNNGCITSAADYMRLKEPSKISRIVNLNDSRANNVFGEVSDLLEAFDYKYPDLEEFIWEQLCLRRSKYKKKGKTGKLAELAAIADRASREQLDVPLFICLGKSPEEIQREAFQAHEHSKLQLEKALELTEVVSEAVQ